MGKNVFGNMNKITAPERHNRKAPTPLIWNWRVQIRTKLQLVAKGHKFVVLSGSGHTNTKMVPNGKW